MDLNFFKQTRILDGGMGQELLARGVKPNGTLWSSSALLEEKYHELLLKTQITTGFDCFSLNSFFCIKA